jgi:hypothetical protein
MTSHQYITYHNDGLSLEQKTTYNHFISLDIEISTKGIKNLIVRYDNISTVIDKDILKAGQKTMHKEKTLWEQLDDFYQNHQEQQKIIIESQVYDCDYKNCFTYGFCSYIAFFYLLQNKHFIKQLPFSFTLPSEWEDGDFCEYNKMNFMVLPLNTILTIIPKTGFIYHLLQRCHQFILLWSPLFHVGPLLSYHLLHQLNYDIVVGVSRYNTHKIDDMTQNMKTLISEEVKASLQDWRTSSLDQPSFVVDPTTDFNLPPNNLPTSVYKFDNLPTSVYKFDNLPTSVYKFDNLPTHHASSFSNKVDQLPTKNETVSLKFKEDEDFSSSEPVLKLKPYLYC